MTQTTSKIGVQILLEALLFHGIEDLVFSPGSRNAPLVIGLVGSGKFRSVCIHDERSAGFYAMGMALVSGKPVPVLCTSGSALLNYAPAVAEAYYQRVPFLVISADRPLEWIDQGDGQTIRQSGVYANFIDYQVSFPSEAQSNHIQWHYNQVIQNALNFAKSGPAHINMPFEEPLYQKVDYKPIHLPQIDRRKSTELISYDQYVELSKQWFSHQKRLVIVGQLKPHHGLNEVLTQLANDPNTVVLSENTSNLEVNGAIPCIDRTLAAIDLEEKLWQPSALMVLGAAVISKKIKTFLRKSDLQLVWKIGEDFPQMNTYKRLDQSFVINPAIFLEEILRHAFRPNVQNDCEFGTLWRRVFKKTEARHVHFLESTKYSDLKVVEHVLNVIPSNSVVHLGNSSIARYTQLFNTQKNLDFHCNRGTSGIDGSVSTAVGAAAKQQNKTHTLVIGDISFFYDSNALWNNYLSENLRIIMIHNGGGGIFEIIPGPNESEFREDYFVAQHDFSAKHVCHAFRIDYAYAHDEKSLTLALEELYNPSTNGRPKFLEVNTKNAENANLLRDYFLRMSFS